MDSKHRKLNPGLSRTAMSMSRAITFYILQAVFFQLTWNVLRIFYQKHNCKSFLKIMNIHSSSNVNRTSVLLIINVIIKPYVL